MHENIQNQINGMP